MEFVIVTYPSERVVNVDGGPLGKTGQKLRMAAGTHDFDLGLPLDFMPGSQTVQVAHTTLTSPLIIAFAPVLVLVESVDEPTLTPPTSMRRGARKRKKFANKEAVKRALRNASKKVGKKAAKKVGKKAAKKVAKKVATKAAKKVAKKAAKKVAKKPAKKVAKKPARKASKKVAKKSAKRSTKKTVRKVVTTRARKTTRKSTKPS